MKIVNRAAFLALPAGTVFCKYEPCVLGDLVIKGDNAGTNDFWYQPIADSIDAKDSSEYGDLLNRAEEEGTSVALDLYCESRDGLFDEDQLFAVWESDDVADLINRLLEALRSGYRVGAPNPAEPATNAH